MSRARGSAPIYGDTFALCEWLIGRFGDDPRVLPRRICKGALSLLDAVSLALKARQREDHVKAADQQLICLRTQLRLAAATGYLRESQVIHALAQAEGIGRQLGGWMRKLDLTV